jgi:hypothetical protein
MMEAEMVWTAWESPRKPVENLTRVKYIFQVHFLRLSISHCSS